ncbi:MAG: hypothetical protein KGD63_09290 [Candidatus Lokiarchaeota archaeon]|nr:hypothetical protein [Candidatus Lokiarchaeota archaeon]
MSLILNQYNSDLDYYSSILEKYQYYSLSRQEIEVWKYKIYMELMDLLGFTENIMMVKNSILLILSLFEDLPPDLYNNQGLKISSLDKKDKNILISNLRKEIM